MIWFVACRALALGAVLTGVAASPAALSGSPWSWVWRPGGVPLGIHLDLVGTVLLTFVGLLGWVVSRYSLTNLRGRDQFARSGATLFVALLGLFVTVTGASLVVVAVGWTFSGQAVAALIVRCGTPQARTASRTMRATLLIGDMFLWAGVTIAAVTLPSLERTRMGEVRPGWSTSLIVALLLGACIARSCQVPAHRWLPETAEAPSPISALLHAGVVNGAGVLVVMFWPLFAAAPLMMALLFAVGAATVAVGAWASRVRSDVKGASHARQPARWVTCASSSVSVYPAPRCCTSSGTARTSRGSSCAPAAPWLAPGPASRPAAPPGHAAHRPASSLAGSRYSSRSRRPTHWCMTVA